MTLVDSDRIDKLIAAVPHGWESRLTGIFGPFCVDVRM